jgi:tetrahydromethanopterin S-methyltransferase subunit E
MGADRSRVGVRARALLATLLASAGLVGAEADASQAQTPEPRVVVAPDHVTETEQVAMEVSGFPEGSALVVQCLGSVTTAVQDAAALCGRNDLRFSPGPRPWHATWLTSSEFRTFDDTQV